MTTLKKSKGKKSIHKLPAALHIHTSPPSVLGFGVLLFCVDLVHAATTTESAWVQTILAHCKHPLPLVVIYQIHPQLTSCVLLISEPDTIFYVQLFHVYFPGFFHRLILPLLSVDFDFSPYEYLYYLSSFLWSHVTWHLCDPLYQHPQWSPISMSTFQYVFNTIKCNI